MNTSRLALAFVLVLAACSDGSVPNARSNDAPSTADLRDAAASVDVSDDATVDAFPVDAALVDTPPVDAPPADGPPMDGASVDASPADALADAPADAAVADAPGVDAPASGDASTTDASTDVRPVDMCGPGSCGVTCFDPVVCGACGNAVCDTGESMDTCPSDCCDPTRCDPRLGILWPDGDARCTDAPDGTRCDDGDLANGIETCRDRRCRHEHVFCRCPPPGGAFPRPTPPDVPAPPTVPADPSWSGTLPVEASFATSWGLSRIDLSHAWERTRGASDVRVAIVDTGCEAMLADLTGQVVAQRDLIDGDDIAQDPLGHGTALASLVAARADGTGIVGVAPNVRLVCARVADALGRAADDALAAGINWAVDQRAKVILVGVGAPRSSATLEAAVQRALDADIVVVAPSGTSGGANVDRFPAALPGVISVAASSRDDRPTRDTDLAPSTWLLAPGEMVNATLPLGEVTPQNGSSPAAAIVAGVAALVRSVDSSLHASQVRALLHATADAVPVTDFARAFVARRVNANSAVRAASSTLVDAAIARVTSIATAGLPREAVLVRAFVENRGATELTDVALTPSVDTGTVTPPRATVARLAPGEIAAVTFTLTPTPTQTRAHLDVRSAVSGDAVAANDRASIDIELGPTVVHRLRIERATLLAPRATESAWRMDVIVENAGNVPELATELRVGTLPGMAPSPVAVPSLAAGERSTLTAMVSPMSGAALHAMAVAFLRPARGQLELASNVAPFRIMVVPAPTASEVAYFQLPGDNLIADTPWRSTRSQIPLMVFYARVRWVEEGAGPFWTDLPYTIHVDRVQVRNPPGPATGAGPLVYEDRAATSAPTTPSDPTLRATYVVRDEDGLDVSSRKVLSSGSPADGTHRILWLPRDALPNQGSTGMVDASSNGAFLEVDFTYWFRDVLIALEQRTRKMLGVAIGGALPTLPGARGDHYFDAHFHSIAEWYTGTELTGPAKAYGGPLEMVLASAWSLGFVDGAFPPSWTSTRDQIITTDHNTYFDDGEAPLAGPSARSRWSSGAGATGSAEFNIYRSLVGATAGEEVSLDGDGFAVSAPSGLGRHSLHYASTHHVSGSWGTLAYGGCLPTPHNFIMGMAGRSADGCYGQNLSVIGGFTYAAHPFADGFVWNDEVLRPALSLPGGTSPGNNHEHVRPASDSDRDGEFVFKGYQFWNGRAARTVRSSWTTGTLRDINPFTGATSDSTWWSWRTWEPTCTGDGGYNTMVDGGLNNYLGHLRDGLLYTFADDGTTPRRRLTRKIFMVGGSDAHGDFDYTLDLWSTVVSGLGNPLGKNSVSDSAWGRPRTYVFGGTLDDMRHGRSVVTDGPVIEAEIDGEGRGDWSNTGGLVAWHDDDSSTASWLGDTSTDHFDPDGRIGGDGRFDGAYTALVPYLARDTGTQRMYIRTRCRNLGEYGGATPTSLEVILTGTGGTTEAPTRIPLTAYACDGAWHVERFELSTPFRAPRAAVVHAGFGSGCPTHYDAYANPIWLTPFEGFAFVRASATTAGVLSLQLEAITNPFTFNFAQSMMREPIQARVLQVADDGTLLPMTGGNDNMGGLIPSPTAASGWADASDGSTSNTRLRLSILSTAPVRGRHRTGITINEERFVIVVERAGAPDGDRRLRDAFGNPLGVMMFRFGPSDVCMTRTCSTDYRFCNSTCSCALARQCTGGIVLGGCNCCLATSCFPLPCVCLSCSSGTDVFSTYCPGG